MGEHQWTGMLKERHKSDGTPVIQGRRPMAHC
jgi:hypothetical protein